jgi:hypothetical protein
MQWSRFVSLLALALLCCSAFAVADSPLPEACQGVDDSPHFLALRQWYSAYNVQFPHLCVGRTKDKGLGIFATQYFEQKQALFISNYSLLFGVHNIQPPELSAAIDAFKEEFKLNDNEILVVYLMASLKNGSSMWQPWLQPLLRSRQMQTELSVQTKFLQHQTFNNASLSLFRYHRLQAPHGMHQGLP